MSKRPNILWLMTDEQRADSLGEGGAPWAYTPYLDRLARDGVRFTAAYTPSPVCISARASLLTGWACSTVGVLNNHHVLSSDRARFLTSCFARVGYQVVGFGKHHYNNEAPAFETQVDRVLGDRVDYTAYRPGITTSDFDVVQYPADEVNRAFAWILAGRFPGSMDETPEARTCADALAWLRSRDPDRPFLLRLSFNAPHTPVVAPAPFDRMIDPGSIELPIDRPDDLSDMPGPVHDYLIRRAGSHRLTVKQIQRTRQCYYGRVAFVDALFGRFLDGVCALGALEGTLVVFTSDHGTHLGDHGFYQKQSFFDASARVPWIMVGPGIQRGCVVRAPVSTGSLLPSLMDLAGLDVPDDLDYRSLAPLLEGGSVIGAAPVFSEIDYGLHGYRPGDRYVMVRHDRWKLVLYRDPLDPGRFPISDGQMLFDLQEDPDERVNRTGDPACIDVVGDLVRWIDGWDRSREIGR